jgi:hypothetical protein
MNHTRCAHCHHHTVESNSGVHIKVTSRGDRLLWTWVYVNPLFQKWVYDVKTCFKNRNTKWLQRWSQTCTLDMSFVLKKHFILPRQKSEILQGYIAVHMWRILSFLDSEIKKKWLLRENFLRTHGTCIRTPIFYFRIFSHLKKCISNLGSRAPRFKWSFSYTTCTFKCGAHDLQLHVY